MRFAVRATIQESNDFVPACCTLEMFQAVYLLYVDAVLDGLRGTRMELAGILTACEELGVSPVPLLAGHSCSYGPLTAECYAHLRSEVLRRLGVALPVDRILFAMHGATVADGEGDPEGDLIGAMQVLAGGVLIGVTLDLHAHVTLRMVEGAMFLVAYSTYPHTVSGTSWRPRRDAEDYESRAPRPPAPLNHQDVQRKESSLILFFIFFIQQGTALPALASVIVVFAHESLSQGGSPASGS